MKTTITSLLILFVSITAFSQIKGKKSEETFTAKDGRLFNVDDIIELKQPSNGEKFAYVYEFKSSMSFKNITNAAKSLNDVKSMNVSNVSSISDNMDNIQTLAKNDMITDSMGSLMNTVVSEKYVTENALDSTFANTKWKIDTFKIYTDKETGEQIVHAMAKGAGKTIAILIDFAIIKGEL
jgi:hypothetical protein